MVIRSLKLFRQIGMFASKSKSIFSHQNRLIEYLQSLTSTHFDIEFHIVWHHFHKTVKDKIDSLLCLVAEGRFYAVGIDVEIIR